MSFVFPSTLAGSAARTNGKLVITTTLDGTITSSNQRFKDFASKNDFQITGNPGQSILDCGQCAPLKGALASLSEHEDGGDFEQKVLGSSCTQWILWSIVPDLETANSEAKVLFVGSDITGEKAFRHALQEISDTEAEIGMDRADRMTRFLDIGCAMLGTSWGRVSTLDGDQCIAEYCSSDAKSASGEDDSVAAIVLGRRGVTAFQSTEMADPMDRLILSAADIGQYIGIVVRVDAQPVGAVTFGGPEPRDTPFDENDVKILRLISQRIAGELSQHRKIEALQRSQERFRALYRRTPIMMHTLDERGLIVEVSDLWLHVTGFSREDVVGFPSTMFLTPKVADSGNTNSNDPTGGSPNPQASAYWLKTRHGFKEVEMSGILDRTLDERHSLAVIIDVTDRNNAQRNLAKRNEELNRSNERLKHFNYVASHDLQEPLRKIRVFCSLLESALPENLSRDATHALTRIRSASQRASSLISDLLAYSRETSRDYEKEPVSLETVIDDVISDLSLVISEADARVTVGELPEVEGDCGSLRILFQNLIGNAIKYRAPDRTPTVEILSETFSNVTRIIVRDNGIGIEPDHRSLVFEPFRRLHTRSEYPGTGIGLAICATIAKGHGWRLHVDSAPSENGSDFVLDIPVRQAQGELAA